MIDSFNNKLDYFFSPEEIPEKFFKQISSLKGEVFKAYYIQNRFEVSFQNLDGPIILCVNNRHLRCDEKSGLLGLDVQNIAEYKFQEKDNSPHNLWIKNPFHELNKYLGKKVERIYLCSYLYQQVSREFYGKEIIKKSTTETELVGIGIEFANDYKDILLNKFVDELQIRIVNPDEIKFDKKYI